MDAALKYKLVEKIIQSDDDALLNRIKKIMGIDDVDFWQELPLSLKEQIQTGKDELDGGSGIAHDQVVAEIKAFLK